MGNQKDMSKQPILFSEILADIPSDAALAELFPHPYQSGKALVTHFGLEILKLRLEGLDLTQVAERLQTTRGRVVHWSKNTVQGLCRGIPDNIEVDIPALRKMLCIRPFNLPGKYTKLSELLQEMPSDQVLLQLDRERGHLNGSNRRRPITNQDLYVLQQRLAGRSYQSIGEEFGKSREATRRWISQLKIRLMRSLGVELDVPGLFGKEEANRGE